MEKENYSNVCQEKTTYCTEMYPTLIEYKVEEDGISHWDEDGYIGLYGGIIKVVFSYTATTVNEDCTSTSAVGFYEDVMFIPPILCNGEQETEEITYGRAKYNDNGIDIWCFYADTKIVGDTSFVLPCEGGKVTIPFEYENDKICMNSLTVKEDEFPDFIKDVSIDTANTVITITTKKNTASFEKGGSILIYNNEKYFETISIILETNEKCRKKTKSQEIVNGDNNEVPSPEDKRYMQFSGEIEFKTPTEGCSNIVYYGGYRLAKRCVEDTIELEEVNENTVNEPPSENNNK